MIIYNYELVIIRLVMLQSPFRPFDLYIAYIIQAHILLAHISRRYQIIMDMFLREITTIILSQNVNL